MCPFCRSLKSANERLERINKRIEANEAEAYFLLGVTYINGNDEMSVKQDQEKGVGLFLRSGELGSTKAYSQLACAYLNGVGVEKDEKKARHYTELAAICGGVSARHNLSIMEFHAGNLDKSVKHAMIAAWFGHARSLKFIQLALIHGFAMKGGYEKALRAYQQYLEAVRSDQRDDAAAYHHDLKYLDNHLSRD